MSNDFKLENPELWGLCVKHGGIIARREKVTQIAILDFYDAVLKLTAHNSDYTKCLDLLSKELYGNDPSIVYSREEVINLIRRHFA